MVQAMGTPFWFAQVDRTTPSSGVLTRASIGRRGRNRATRPAAHPVARRCTAAKRWISVIAREWSRFSRARSAWARW